MSTLEEIIVKGKGNAGSRGAWHVTRLEDRYCLVHYQTIMLQWTDGPMGTEIIDFSTGHGSVSDQNGMNIAFTALGLNYRYDRDWKGGGARITHLPCGLKYLDCHCAWDQLYRTYNPNLPT